MLILSADVGEGHAAAARALAQQLRALDDDLQVTTIDGLAASGRLLRLAVEHGYHAQLRFAPWTYTVLYWLLEHVAPCRWLARLQLSVLGSRPLLRRIAEHDPDVIISTYPAVTVVLSRLRRIGAVRCVTVATITDLTGLFFWAQPGIDLHLVMYRESLHAVGKIAGRESVRAVEPILDRQFWTLPTQTEARRELGLASEARIVVVSGGGWGVGDISGAVRELADMAEIDCIICLAGRSEAVYRRLEDEFSDLESVTVLGFTERMATLLAAADAIVHSTGGVTCLEARVVGTPVVCYGLPFGHARVNNRALAKLGLVRLAGDKSQLRAQVRATLAQPRAELASAATDGGSRLRSASAEILDARARVRVIPRWRMRLVTTMIQLVLVAAVALWTLSTDEMTGAADAILDVHALAKVATSQSDVGIIVSVEPTQVTAVARGLAMRGIHASLADPVVPPPRTIATIRALGEELVPEIPPSRQFLRWLRTSATLHSQASAAGFRRPFYFLEPPGGVTVGQLVLARAAGATPIKGALRLSANGRLPERAPQRGDVLVVSADSSSRGLAGVRRIVAWLARNGLASEPFGQLTSSHPLTSPHLVTSGIHSTTTAGERPTTHAAATRSIDLQDDADRTTG